MTNETGVQPGAADEAARDDEVDYWAEADATEGVPTAEGADEGTEAEAAWGDASGEEAEAEAEATAEAPRPDPWASATPEMIAERDRLRNEFATLQQRMRSEQGRVAAYQRRYEELRRKAQAPDTTEQDEAAIKAAEEEFPEVVKPIIAKMSRQQQQIEALRESELSRQQRAAEAREAHEMAETQKVAAEFPDWQSITTVDDGEGGKTATPEFVAWYRMQDPGLRAKVERNAEGITNATEVVEVLGAYRSFLDRLRPAANPAGRAGTHSPPSRRERQLQSASAVSSRPQVGRSSGVPRDDPDAAWDAFDRIDAQQRANAR